MSEEEKEYSPDWKKIKKLSDELDKIVDKGIEDDMNFLEIDMAMYMVCEKIRQEKHRILNQMESEEQQNDKKPHGIYG